MKRYNITFPLDVNRWEKSPVGKYYSQSFTIGDWYKADLQPTIEQTLQLQKDDVYGLYTYVKQGICWVCAYKNCPTVSMEIPGILWEKKKNLNITYDANGGVFADNRKTINDIIYRMEDEKIVLSAPLWGHQEMAHRDGYYFLYWSPIGLFDNEPTGEVFELNENIFRDTYLKAVWKKEAGLLLEKQSWYLGETDKTLIKEIQIVDYYQPDENYTVVESWNADAKGFNDITCYIQTNENNDYRLIIAGNEAGYINLGSDASGMFSGFTGVTNILGLEIFDSSSTQNMKEMFMNCSALTSLSLRGLKFDIVTDLTNFCSGCTALTTVEFDSQITVNRLTKMIAMFKGCINLTSVTFPTGFDFSKVLAASFAFYGCEKLTNVNFPSGYSFEKINQINSMFYNCYSLTSLDLTGFNTNNITSLSSCKNFIANTSLYTFSIGEKWGINFVDVGLTSPTFDISDGYWYDQSTNIGYEVDAIPTNVNATYTAVAPTA